MNSVQGLGVIECAETEEISNRCKLLNIAHLKSGRVNLLDLKFEMLPQIYLHDSNSGSYFFFLFNQLKIRRNYQNPELSPTLDTLEKPET